VSDLTINVRQVSSYPAVTTTLPGDTFLLQRGGLGGSYFTVDVETLVRTALNDPTATMAINALVPPDAQGAGLIASNLVTPVGFTIGWNWYINNAGGESLLQSGAAGALGFDTTDGLVFVIGSGGAGGTAVGAWTDLLQLTPAGALNLFRGTLTVARDPAFALEVATMGWVGRNTVMSLNGRTGAVVLNYTDIATALGADSAIATQNWVNAAICGAINSLLQTYPSVWTFNGRTGDIWLTVQDMNSALAVPNAVPLIIQTPPANAFDGEVVNAAWVIANTTQMLAPYATQDWVTQQAAVSSFNGRTGHVTLAAVDITSAGGALLASPNFSGIPTGPTANPGTATAQLATTAFVEAAVVAGTAGVVSFNTRTGAVTLSAADINNAGGALLASPNFTGTPTGPTAVQGTSTAQLATTAFVMNEITAISAGVITWNGRSGTVTMTLADVTGAGGAPLASPGFSGIPTAPTAVNGTDTTQLATCAFVQNAINAVDVGVTTFNGRSGTVSLIQNDITAVGGLVNPSPALTGTPTAPTPAPTDSSTNIATTAFVKAAIASTAGASVATIAPTSPNTGQLWFNTTSGVNQLYVWTGSAWTSTTNLSTYAPLASPAFTGTPTAPTPVAGNSSTQIATTAFVTNLVAGYLPLSGGTLTGTLTTAAVVIPSTPTLNPALYFNVSGGNYITNGVGFALALYPNPPTSLMLYYALSGTAGAAASLNGMTQWVPGATPANNNIIFNSNFSTSGGYNQAWNAQSTAAGGWAYISGTSGAPVAAATAAILSNGNWALAVAPMGTAGAAITFNQVLTATPSLVTCTTQFQCNGQLSMAGGAGIMASTAGIYLPAPASLWSVLGGTNYPLINMDTTGNVNIAPQAFPGSVSFPNGNVNFNGNGITLPNGTSVWWYQAGSSVRMTGIWIDGNNNINIGGGSNLAFNIYANTPPGSQGGGFNLPTAIPWATQSTWNVYSDSRTKDEVADYTPGLNEICQLKPISYCYNGRYGTDDERGKGVKHIGFDAVQASSVIAEMKASRRAASRPDGPEDTELAGLNHSPLVCVLINAVKELNARIVALEARA
jgi:hypothetical protein